MIEIIPNWHPVFVHFTIGLLGTAVLFFLLSIVVPVSDGLKANWQIVARWCLWTGMAVTVLTVSAGYFAYNTVAHDTPSHAAMTEHRNWAFTTVGGFLVVTLWSLWLHFKKKVPGNAFLIVALISGGLLASTGWHGGEVVYRYGLGVMSMPQIDAAGSNDEGHAHEHSAGSGHEAGITDVKRLDQKSDDGHNHKNPTKSANSEGSISDTKTRSTETDQHETGKDGHAHDSGQSHAH